MLYNLQVSKSFASTLLLNTQFSSHLHSICLSAQAKLKNDMKNSPHFLHFTFKYSSSPTALSNVTYKKKVLLPFLPLFATHEKMERKKWIFNFFLKKTFQSSCIEKRSKKEKLFLAHLHPFSAPCDTFKIRCTATNDATASFPLQWASWRELWVH